VVRFQAMKIDSAVALLGLALFPLVAVAAEVYDFKVVGGKEIMCMHTGLTSDLHDCGVKSDWYTYVFVGSIASITPLKEGDGGEFQLQITPVEVFHGQPPTPLIVKTSRGLCFPELVIGDHWLFFLRKEKEEPIVLDYYGNDSRPVADAGQEIETLRRLKAIGHAGILRGQVLAGPWYAKKPVAKTQVIARRTSDHRQFLATTSEDGHYEFNPLPPGDYDLIARESGLKRLIEGPSLTPGSCWDLTVAIPPKGQISGHVRHRDGAPFAHATVLIINLDTTSWSASETDESGHFDRSELEPGHYVIGMFDFRPDLLGRHFDDSPPPAVSLYYPGVKKRADAKVITVTDDGKRNYASFVVP